MYKQKQLVNVKRMTQLGNALILLCITAAVTAGLGRPVHALLSTDAKPAIDLNGPDATGTDYVAPAFVEDDGPVSITSQQLSITADGELSSASVALQENPNKSREILRATADLSGTRIKQSYSTQRGLLKLEGPGTVGEYETVLRSVTYENQSDAPETTDRRILFTVTVGGEASEPATSTMAISATNDAPILDDTGDMKLAPIEEDDHAQIGTTVASIIGSAEMEGQDRITDPDLTDPEGIAVIKAADINGVWQYSTDAGASWTGFGEVSNNSALLLNPLARVRFLPAANYSGQDAIIFRAWDQSTEETNGERADASMTGGSTAFSVTTESATIEVLVVDDAPSVDLNGSLPGSEFAATFLSQGTPVPVSAADAAVVDVDSDTIVSMTVTLTNRPDGQNESLIAAQTQKVVVDGYDPATGTVVFSGAAAPEEYSAVLQGLRYLNEAPNMNTEERVIEFVASDGTSDSDVVRAFLTSKLSNRAPVLNTASGMAFTAIDEDTAGPAGDSVGSLLAGAATQAIEDEDEGDPRGFAVIGAENSNGIWQFSVDTGQTWLPVGLATEKNALLLVEGALMRFVPQANFSAASRSVRVRAWDQSSGFNGQRGADTSQNGGLSAFSADSTTIPIYIRPVNDPPRISLSQNTVARFTEGNGPVAVAGPTIEIVDVDNERLQSATVVIDNKVPTEPDFLHANISGSSPISASYDDSSGILRLTGPGSVADYQAIFRSVTFDNLSEDPLSGERLVTFQASDGAQTSNSVSGKVIVEAMNDAPMLDLSGEDTPGNDNTLYYDENDQGLAPAILLSSALQIQDVDNTTLVGASVELEQRPDGKAENLSIDVSGTNIDVAYGDDRRTVRLTGQETLAAYQSVLRTVTYANSRAFANRLVRKVRYTVQDASSGTSEATAEIVVRPQFVVFPVLLHNIDDSGPVEEPNNRCEEALALLVDRDYAFGATDQNDWFSFRLPEPAVTHVKVSGFAPEAGQLLVAEGSCGQLTRIGHNGDFSTTKSVDLGRIGAGRYYIWLINDGPTNLGQPYQLRISTE